jgi:hypothetical protein
MMNRWKVQGWFRNSLLCKGASALLITSLTLTSSWAKGAEKTKPDVHQQITKWGTGAKVTVDLTDGTTTSGTIKSTEEQSFTLDGGKKKGVSTIPYTSVKSVAKGAGLPSGVKIGILVVVAVVVVAVVVVAVKVSGKGGSLCPNGASYCNIS